VVVDLAVGAPSASGLTGVGAAEVHAGLVQAALAVADALSGHAPVVRVADGARGAVADGTHATDARARVHFVAAFGALPAEVGHDRAGVGATAAPEKENVSFAAECQSRHEA